MLDYRYKVHLAICSWNIPGALKTITENVTDKAQKLLNDPKNQGILKINSDFLEQQASGTTTSFAMIVSICSPGGHNVTRMCTSPDVSLLNINEAGIICNF